MSKAEMISRSEVVRYENRGVKNPARKIHRFEGKEWHFVKAIYADDECSHYIASDGEKVYDCRCSRPGCKSE